MMARPDIAVVIPLYNAERWIAETLESVFAQTLPPSEVVVVDDGSTDEGAAIVTSRFPDARILRHPGKGANAARRYGQEHTSAPLVTFLDQDDVWHPDHLRLLVALLDEHPNAPAVIGQTLDFLDGAPLSFETPRLAGLFLDPWERFPATCTPTPSGVLMRRAALDAMGGWPTAYLGVADFYTWLRLSVEQPLVFNACTTVFKRAHPTSHSRQLVADRVARYVRDKRRAALDVLDVREAVYPEDNTDIDSLRALTIALEDIVRALVAEDETKLRDAALRLDDALANASDKRAVQTLGMIAWYVRPLFESRGEHQWEWMLRSWPSSANRTHRLLQTRISVRAQLRRALRQPWRLPPWQTTFDLALKRLRR